jgi:hypothetical protein
MARRRTTSLWLSTSALARTRATARRFLTPLMTQTLTYAAAAPSFTAALPAFTAPDASLVPPPPAAPALLVGARVLRAFGGEQTLRCAVVSTRTTNALGALFRVRYVGGGRAADELVWAELHEAMQAAQRDGDGGGAAGSDKTVSGTHAV